MPRKKPANRRGAASSSINIGEEVRIAVKLQLKKFLADPAATECEFPSSLFAEERAYIHNVAKEYGLRSKSRGKNGINRAVTVYKREGSSIVQADPAFTLSPTSRHLIRTLLVECPITAKERQDLLPQLERDKEREISMSSEVKEIGRAMGRLSSGVPQVPKSNCNPEVLPFRKGLPIWNMQDAIVETILTNQIVLIAGETGSGKTTQVPQFILEHCQRTGTACRIVCTEPRRISAVSVSERVSTERNESLGQSVGYQIRLESRVSPKTVLTYCTNGVLLRTLMGGDSILSTLTHIIVDEVHERDRFSDFLLISLRDALQKYKDLRLILMSATLDISVFTKYFNNCPVITVPGRQYEVQEYFLEDVLKLTGYLNGHKPPKKKDVDPNRKPRKELEKWTQAVSSGLESKEDETEDNEPAVTLLCDEPTPEVNSLDPLMVEQLDKCIEEAWLHGSEEAFTQILYFIQTENVPVDYQHSGTGACPLMLAAGRGQLEMTEQFLYLGANLNVKANNGWTALDWAVNCNKTATAELIQNYMKLRQSSSEMPSEVLQTISQEMSDEDNQLLEMYHQCFNDDEVDVKLCLALIYHLHSRPDKGAILIFLPGYDVITTLRDCINDEREKFSQVCRFSLYTLHSNMQTSDQRRVFQPAPANTRKIILSTNIAETSVTIDDVVYVIDSGKVKEKSFDAISGVSSLRDEWISQACARQRKGRAGRTRPGLCYHMFSKVRYRSLQQHQTPEILRMPLQELCLHTKLLAAPNTAIADFLSKAMEPPPFMVTRNAVQLLKTIDALDPWEDLTELGHHLLDLPVEPRLGKMLLHAVVLKCLDPVLTIVCTLAYKDPFVLPTQPSLRNASRASRRSFSAGSFSDHMAMLRAFQAWQLSRSTGREASFCQKNFISSATMEQVMSLRAQLLGQLRASGFVRAKGGGDIRDLNSHAENWAVVKAALTAGFYPNIARVDRAYMQLRTFKESMVAVHPSSTLRDADIGKVPDNLPTDWLVFEEMSRAGKLCQIRMCTVISPITVALFAGPMRLPSDALSSSETSELANQYQSDSEWEEQTDGNDSMLKLDEWINFCIDGEAAHLAFQLRQKWNSTFLRRMRCPSKSWNPADDAVIQAVVQILSSEEKQLGLQQPEGIGQRPRPVNIDFHTSARNKHHDVNDTDSVSSENSNHSQRVFHNSSRFGKKMSSESGCSSISPDDSAFLSNYSSPSTGVKYFVIKAGTPKAVETSRRRNLWAFTPGTERKVLTGLQEGNIVMLIFSMQGSGSFQGVASLVGSHPSDSDTCSDLAGPNLGSPLPIKWLKYGDIPFQATRHLMNPYNDGRNVQTSRDGQELEPNVALHLCSLWDRNTHSNQFYHNAQSQSNQQSHSQGGRRPIRGNAQNRHTSTHESGRNNGAQNGFGRHHQSFFK
ncbi:3'-5' RNA helicase YTHDC2-like [Thrips palmi]|uniref:3'-5' RNA helicase YTHDC2-like n=1 Tax=Thrips palmi TaxID=161013 RepID=A0A6P9AAH5_THRPL|nr:3'-5' RNA helicase YTHDC2-like [Thrips palmi]XP_034254480.1 3'-5' RNA helicase YTHDC2-like [Thrips palmi]